LNYFSKNIGKLFPFLDAQQLTDKIKKQELKLMTPAPTAPVLTAGQHYLFLACELL
jgi:hypothetical protein